MHLVVSYIIFPRDDILGTIIMILGIIMNNYIAAYIFARDELNQGRLDVNYTSSASSNSNSGLLLSAIIQA